MKLLTIKNLSIRAKLYLITFVAFTGILVQAASGLHGIRQGNAALNRVYENNVVPLADLQEIDTLVKEVRFRMAAGAAASSLAAIQQNAAKSAAAVSDIAAATREQNSASFELAKDVERVAMMTDESVTVINGTAASALQLRQLAENLKNAVERLKV